MKVKVLCSFEVVVELPDDAHIEFIIEENGCPGTGIVGAALQKLMNDHEQSGTCWACAAQGENKIIEVLP